MFEGPCSGGEGLRQAERTGKLSGDATTDLDNVTADPEQRSIFFFKLEILPLPLSPSLLVPTPWLSICVLLRDPSQTFLASLAT